MPVDLQTIHYVLSSMASTGKILESIFKLREYGMVPTREQFKSIEAGAKEPRPPEASSAILLSVSMSGEVVDAILKRNEKVKKDLQDTYMDGASSIADRQRQADICRREFCWNLQQIRHHNGGKLPDEWEQQWDLQMCSQ
jgi:hypothetical protein